MPTDAQRKANLRLAWILAAVAAAVVLGYVVRMTWFRA